MRLLIPVALLGVIGVAQAAETEKPAYCVNQAAEFYPYRDGQNCKPGYQLAQGNCRLKDGRMLAIAKDECTRMSGDLALPSPAARLTGEGDPKKPAKPEPLTVQNPKPH
jgi:hypothetical protein